MSVCVCVCVCMCFMSVCVFVFACLRVSYKWTPWMDDQNPISFRQSFCHCLASVRAANAERWSNAQQFTTNINNFMKKLNICVFFLLGWIYVKSLISFCISIYLDIKIFMLLVLTKILARYNYLRSNLSWKMQGFENTKWQLNSETSANSTTLQNP